MVPLPEIARPNRTAFVPLGTGPVVTLALRHDLDALPAPYSDHETQVPLLFCRKNITDILGVVDFR